MKFFKLLVLVVSFFFSTISFSSTKKSRESELEKVQSIQRLLDKKLKKKRRELFLSKKRKKEASSVYIEQAGQSFKAIKKYKEANDCYIRAAEISLELGRKDKAAHFYARASTLFTIMSDPLSLVYGKKALTLYSEEGQGGIAAALAETLAHDNSKVNKIEEALVYLEEAKDLYKGEGLEVKASLCLENIAILYVRKGSRADLIKAASLFEEIGLDKLSNHLARFLTHKFFFRSVLCTMASTDIIGSRVKFEEFKEADFCFKNKKEAALLENLLSSLSELNLGNFREAISDHARITPLDSWHMNLFQKIEKENLKNDILKGVNQEQKEEQEGSGDLGDNIFA